METKKAKTTMIVGLLALAGLAVIFLPAYAGDLEPSGPPGPTMKTLDEVEPRIPIHASDLPLTITEPNSYYLAETINFTDDANHAITIEANDVTIDLAGFSLIGPGSGTGNGIYMNGRSNVEVRNGTVRSFGYYGICETDVNGGEHRVIGVRVLSNGATGVFLHGWGCLVKDCTVTGNNKKDLSNKGGINVSAGGTVAGNTVRGNQGDYGIYGGAWNTVTGNTVFSNQGDGITTSWSCTITGNTVFDNQFAGIDAGAGSTVTGNAAYGNSYGISAPSGCTVTCNSAYKNDRDGIHGSVGCTVTGNTVRNNNQGDYADHAGIRVYSGCLVKGNTANSNKQSNIYVETEYNAIEENLVTDSTNGIYFDSGGSFYANNRASGNVTDYNDVHANYDGGGNVSF